MFRYVHVLTSTACLHLQLLFHYCTGHYTPEYAVVAMTRPRDMSLEPEMPQIF